MTTAAVTPRGAAAYDRVARAVHWLVAVLAFGVVWLGWNVAAAPRNTPQRDLLMLGHQSVGLTILGVMVFRAWWRWRHPPPAPPPVLSWLEAKVAWLNHLALYVLLLAMPLIGYCSIATAGHSVSVFGVVSIPPLLAQSNRWSQITIAVHLVGQYALYLLVALHLAGALLHGVVRRDGVVGRMLPLRHRT